MAAATRGASTEPDETVQMALGQLREYFAGQRRDFTLPLDLPPMEPVSEAVLQALRTVRYGETITYGELAKLSGTGVPARAIGEIMAANPVPIIIPCHRVVASDGLGGYSGGEPGRQLETKRWLLENEGALPPRCHRFAGLRAGAALDRHAANNSSHGDFGDADRLLCRRWRSGRIGARPHPGSRWDPNNGAGEACRLSA